MSKKREGDRGGGGRGVQVIVVMVVMGWGGKLFKNDRYKAQVSKSA